MKLVSWNVNGLRSIYKKGFEAFVEKEQPDILCLQETKIQTEQAEANGLTPKGYSAYFSSAVKKGYSGVVSYVKDGFTFQENKLATAIGIEKFDSEGRFLILHHKDFILYNIYFPSGTTGERRQDFKYEFLDALLEHLKSLPKTQRNKLIVTGDFNICHKEIDIHHPREAEKRKLSGFLPDERKWMDTFTELGFVDSFRQLHGESEQKFSWWSYRANSRGKNLGWRIDYFFTAKTLEKKISNASIMHNVMGSDHCPIVLELSL